MYMYVYIRLSFNSKNVSAQSPYPANGLQGFKVSCLYAKEEKKSLF